MEPPVIMTLLIVLGAWQISRVPCACEVNVTWMEQALTQHFSKPRHHVTNPDYKQQAMQFIWDEFQAMGLESHLDHFATAVKNVTGTNVIGLLKGRHFNTDKDRVMGIGAHYDTMRNTPGVDDNGAAVVVMLQAARELSRQPTRDYTLIFIAFDFEEWEQPYVPLAACTAISCGSRSLVQNWLPNFWHQPLTWQGIFIMDTIMNFNHTEDSQNFPPGIGQVFPEQTKEILADGDRGDFLMIAGRQADQGLLDSFHQAWAKMGSQPQYEIEQFTVPQISPEFADFLRSDHYSFWLKNLSAIFITDTANFRGYMTNCYHHPCDTMDHVTPSMLDFAAKTCRALISALNDMSPATSSSAKFSFFLLMLLFSFFSFFYFIIIIIIIIIIITIIIIIITVFFFFFFFFLFRLLLHLFFMFCLHGCSVALYHTDNSVHSPTPFSLTQSHPSLSC